MITKSETLILAVKLTAQFKISNVSLTALLDIRLLT